MKIVIQCAGGKREGAGHLKNKAGRSIVFVAHPDVASRHDPEHCFCHPDERMGTGRETWRDFLEEYNGRGTNPEGLCRAGDLYRPQVYQALVKYYGWDNVFILSAGWGLIRSDFFIPYYDITFSTQAERWARRRIGDAFKDFNQLQASAFSPDESIYFFGGQSYLSLYYALTKAIPARKIVYCASANWDAPPGYQRISYPRSTNWHYRCAKDFIEG